MRQHLGEIGRAAGLLIVAAVIAALVSGGSRFGCVQVPTDYRRMEPSVKPGARLRIERGAQTLEQVPVGSVVLFRLDDADAAQPGRVIAHAGQVVAVKDGRYLVDGAPLKTKANAAGLGAMRHVLVPAACVMVGFDARHSAPLADCIVPLRHIIGRAMP